MHQHFLALVAGAPEAIAIIEGDSGNTVTRADLRDRADELAARLTRAGMHAGDLVAVQLPNSVEYVAAFLAALKLRLVFVPIDRDAPETEVAAILSHFSIKGFIYRTDRSTRTSVISTRTVRQPPRLPAGACMMKLTSGSTGLPKAIVCSAENLVADSTNICSTMQIAPADLNLGAIPFSHSYGFANLVLPLVLQGTAIVVTNDYVPLSTLALCNRYGCTVVPLIPMVFDLLGAQPREDGDFRTVRTFISAGAPLTASASRRFRERFAVDIHTFYGCSEVGGITYDRAGAAVERGTVGTPLDNVRLDLDVSTQRLSIHSASVGLGYLSDALRFKPFEGVFRTDDLVELTPPGEIVLTGRVGDLINTASKKVNPREVELVIQQIDGVRQVKVYGEPAGARGEVVAAAVVAEPDVTREQIRDFCGQRLSSHKVPRIVKLIEQIPVDERGKVKRAALAEL
jgi:long-chain acyl-CoA synthetase